jgi:hypothetical protein
MSQELTASIITSMGRLLSVMFADSKPFGLKTHHPDNGGSKSL